MNNFIPYKCRSGEKEHLTWTGDAWSCSEGDIITIETRTQKLPIVRLAGRTLAHEHLSLADQGYLGQYLLFIDTWAGRTNLEIQDGTSTSTLTFQVQPSQRKLGQDEFDAMLHELAQRNPGILWGLSPGGHRGAASKSSPAVVHPAIINSQLPLLNRLFALFIAEPPKVTLRSREAQPLDLARRVDLTTMRWLGRRPLVLEGLRGNITAGSYTNQRTPIDQPKTFTSLDHPITRYFAYLLHRLINRFRDSSQLLRAGPKRAFRDPVVESHAEALAITLDQATGQIENLLSLPPFRCLCPEPPTETVYQLLGDQPLFGAINRSAQLLLTPGLAHGPSGDIYSALKHTYDLFEIFVLFRLIDNLEAALGETWKLEARKTYIDRRREERPGDRAVWLFRGPEETTLELRYQQWFSRMKTSNDGRMFTSLSGLNIPDYVLILRKDRVVVSWVILDAKYRSGRQAVDQGLGDVHRYRDALRVRGIRASGAFVVVPRLQDENAVYSTSTYHERYNFGALQLFSGSLLQPVLKALDLI